jgi:hypothetical protein
MFLWFIPFSTTSWKDLPRNWKFILQTSARHLCCSRAQSLSWVHFVVQCSAPMRFMTKWINDPSIASSFYCGFVDVSRHFQFRPNIVQTTQTIFFAAKTVTKSIFNWKYRNLHFVIALTQCQSSSVCTLEQHIKDVFVPCSRIRKPNCEHIVNESSVDNVDFDKVFSLSLQSLLWFSESSEMIRDFRVAINRETTFLPLTDRDCKIREGSLQSDRSFESGICFVA